MSQSFTTILFISWIVVVPLLLVVAFRRRRKREVPTQEEILAAVQKFSIEEVAHIGETLRKHQLSVEEREGKAIFGIFSLLQRRSVTDVNLLGPAYELVDSLGIVEVAILLEDMFNITDEEFEMETPFPYTSALHFLYILSVVGHR